MLNTILGIGDVVVTKVDKTVYPYRVYSTGETDNKDKSYDILKGQQIFYRIRW